VPSNAHRSPSIRVGTSGWSYDHWRGVFYPEDLPPARRLEYYAAHFNTVEIDGTFYRVPSEQAVRAWRSEVPDRFAFAVKGSRTITHFRRLANAEEATQVFLERMESLGGALEVVLWQLPPNMKRDTERLDSFLGGLPKSRVRHAVEFRHESWLCEETFSVLRRHGAAHVNVSSDAMPDERTVTADFVYVRFHGTATYHGAYERPTLEPWARFLTEQRSLGRDVFAYFNNDAEGHAPRDAARLISMLDEEKARPPLAGAAPA
jgi:uncharacterized protein YecE (DUF72 family)